MKGYIAVRKPVGTPVVIAAATTSVPANGTYVQLQATPAVAASAIQVFNTTAQPIQLATGAAGSEVVAPLVIAPNTASDIIPFEVKKGIRLAATSATSTAASTGFLVINFFG